MRACLRETVSSGSTRSASLLRPATQLLPSGPSGNAPPGFAPATKVSTGISLEAIDAKATARRGRLKQNNDPRAPRGPCSKFNRTVNGELAHRKAGLDLSRTTFIWVAGRSDLRGSTRGEGVIGFGHQGVRRDRPGCIACTRAEH